VQHVKLAFHFRLRISSHAVSAGPSISPSVSNAMPFRQPSLVLAAAACAACVATFVSVATRASAATPVSVEAAAQFPLADSGRNAGGSAQTAFGLDYDLGPQTIVPLRASLDLDDANGSRGNGRINVFAAGGAVRLTTPIYAGAGLSLVTINVRPAAAAAFTTNATGIATDFFVGERIIGLPGGTSVSLQADYKKLPRVAGIDPSAVALGLRVQL